MKAWKKGRMKRKKMGKMLTHNMNWKVVGFCLLRCPFHSTWTHCCIYLARKTSFFFIIACMSTSLCMQFDMQKCVYSSDLHKRFLLLLLLSPNALFYSNALKNGAHIQFHSFFNRRNLYFPLATYMRQSQKWPIPYFHSVGEMR